MVEDNQSLLNPALKCHPFFFVKCLKFGPKAEKGVDREARRTTDRGEGDVSLPSSALSAKIHASRPRIETSSKMERGNQEAKRFEFTHTSRGKARFSHSGKVSSQKPAIQRALRICLERILVAEYARLCLLTCDQFFLKALIP